VEDEMIEHLKIGRTANFYKRKKVLSDNAISQLFTTVRRTTTEPSRNLFREVRTVSGEVRYSVICFDFARQPSFLKPEADVWERIYGFLLIVEKEDLVAVLKSGLDLPSEFKSSYLEKLAGHQIEIAIAQENAVFEKLRLRNMSTSRFALRSKTLEANNLENTVPVSSASRFVPQAYTVSRQDGNYSATPNTGRISNQNERTGLEEIVAWAGEMIDALKAEQGQTAAFIKNFARPVSLSDIPATTHPTFLAFDVGSLKEAFYGEGPRYRLVRKQNDGFVEATRQASEAIFDDLDENFTIGPVADEYPILDPEDGSECGSVAIRKTRIGLPGFTRQLLGDIYVEDLSGDGGEDLKRKLFSRFLDQEDRFVLLFSDLSLAYIEGALFRDDAILAGGATFMAHLQSWDALAAATDEKGNFTQAQTEFDEHSVFRIVVDEVADEAGILLCDDLSDEWADFIAVNTTSHPPTVSFYHAKHGEPSLGASGFHISVSQAIKNLGRMTMPEEVMETKYRGWDRNYAGDDVESSIARIVRGGTRQNIEDGINLLRTAPDLVKRVYIVTSSLSRAAVAAVFANAAQGVQPRPHFVQLYWLLMTYFSACAEVGVVGYVICQP
jgi:hypothetical protein